MGRAQSAIKAEAELGATPRHDDQNNTLGSVVRDVYLGYRRVLQEELAPLNVSLPKWTFLRILWSEDGLTQKALSALAGNHPSTSVDTLRTLEADGLIERRPDSGDGRAMRVYLTKKGQDSRATLSLGATQANERATAGMTKQQVEMLRQLLVMVRFNLDRD